MATWSYQAWHTRRTRATLRYLVAALALGVLGGCGRESGQVRYRVSGRITFAGEPVPYGEVLFTPDASKGNSGPQGIAIIKNGRYDTAGSRAPGIAGGPTVVRVTALRDPSGKLLCEYLLELDLPRADSVQDIDIPASAVKPPAAGPEI
jgi:hypothetical protein